MSRRTAYWPLRITERLREGKARLVAVRQTRSLVSRLVALPFDAPRKQEATRDDSATRRPGDRPAKIQILRSLG